MLGRFFKSRARRDAVLQLYSAISTASRSPFLYSDLNIPDTAEGRFESLGLHLSLVLRRLKPLPAPALDVSKDLIDLFFQELDGALRALGVSDVSVGKKIKVLAQAFYGRAKALDEALNGQGATQNTQLQDVLRRNVLGIADGDAPTAPLLAQYVQDSVAKLAIQDLAKITTDMDLFCDSITVANIEANHE